jgi:hypothetical protein
MPEQTYASRIRHPSGALDPPREKNQSPGLWLLWWLIVELAVLAITAWHMGWLSRLGMRVASAVESIPNPYGWV